MMKAPCIFKKQPVYRKHHDNNSGQRKGSCPANVFDVHQLKNQLK